MVKIYEPDANPIRGARSRATAAQNQPGSGYFPLLQNVRWADDGVLAARLGVPAALSAALGAASYLWRGVFSMVFNGAHGYLVGCMKDTSNLTHIYTSTDGVTWTERTTAAGTKYGDTRLDADGSGNDYEASCAVVHDKFSGKDVAIVQNGFAYPRVWDGTNLVKHEAVALPSNTNFMRSFLGWKEPVALNDGAKWNPGGGAAAVVITDPAVASPNNYAVLTIGAAATGDNAYLDLPTTVNWQSAKQIHFIVEANSLAINKLMQGIKITVRDTAGAPATKSLYEPYDPAVAGSDNYQQPYVTPIFGGASWSVVSYQVPTDWITAAADRVTFTWALSTTGSGTHVVNLLAIAASNYSVAAINGAFEHQVSYYNSGSRAESPSITLNVQTQLVTALGVRRSNVAGTVSTEGALIPNDPALAYTVDVWYRNTTTAERDKGVDTLRVYRQNFGEETYSYSKAITLAAWGGAAWAFSSGTASSLLSSQDTTVSGSRLFDIPAPGGYNQPIPIGRAMCSTNGRLLVGAKATDSSGTKYDAFQRVSVSRARLPFRFSEVSDSSDPFSAAEERLAGENVQGFAASGGRGGIVGSSNVFVFTDTNVWSVATHAVTSSLILTRALAIGTNSPLSIVEREGEVYFFDTDMRLRRLSDGTWLSSEVDDRFQGIPAAYRRKLCGMYHNDRLYYAYTPAGGTANTQILVFSLRKMAWESDDKLPGSLQADFLCRWVGASGTYATSQEARILILSTGDRKVYRYESGATDLGASVAVAITTGDLHEGLWKGFVLRRWGGLFDGVAATLTGTPTYKPNVPAGIAGGGLTITAAKAYFFGFCNPSFTSTTEVGNGVAVSLAITGSLPGGTRIYALTMDDLDANVQPVAA